MESNSQAQGPFEVRYLAFLETVVQIRPRLHRYCSRMAGSVLDGEDVVQDALFEAYRKLDQYDDSRPLSPWIFRIAHNRCIDFLRRQQVRDKAETSTAVADFLISSEPVSLGVRPALEHLVLTLPPKERACVLLKDVFDYSLEETAELVNSTVGGVKAALNRARMKLASSPALPQSLRKTNRDPELTRVMQLYVDRFNRRDWDGVRELISADASLRVADAFAGRLADSPYFGNYERWSLRWKMSLGEIDHELAVIVLRRGVDTWTPVGVVRLILDGQQIRRVLDYTHCPWVAPLLMPREDVATGRPITPLHGGHVGLLCTAGLLNGVFGDGENRHIARWRSVKHVTTFVEEDGDAQIIHHRERWTHELRLVYADGRVLKLMETPTKKEDEDDGECTPSTRAA